MTHDPSTVAQSADDLARVGRMIIQLFDRWNLSTADRQVLLGRPGEDSCTLTALRNGKPPEGDSDILERATILLRIHKSLRQLFPANADLAYRWMSQPNRRFDGLAPIKLVQRDGLSGLYAIDSYLEDKYGS